MNAVQERDIGTVAEPSLLLGAEQVAGLLSISPRHFHAMRQSGQFAPEPVFLGRSVRWRRSDVMVWIADGCPVRSRWAGASR